MKFDSEKYIVDTAGKKITDSTNPENITEKNTNFKSTENDQETKNVDIEEEENTDIYAEDDELTEDTVDNAFQIEVSGVEKGDVLNIRASASPYAEIVRKLAYDDPKIYTIVETTKYGSSTWGKLKSGVGWINLKYTKRV